MVVVEISSILSTVNNYLVYQCDIYTEVSVLIKWYEDIIVHAFNSNTPEAEAGRSWSVSGLDKEADLVHMEVRTADGYAHYLTCRIQECAETTRSGPFARSIDISSLVVQDEYIFIQVTIGGRASYYVSYRREAFAQIKLPKYSLPK
ncbi:hypothetical protein STEG23_026871, partial [Scotinomys teguina]